MPHVFFRPVTAFALLCLLCCPPLLAQKNKSQQPLFQCAVPELSPQQRQALEAEAAFALQVKRATQGKATTITYVPIRPHILRASNGTGGYGLTSMNNVMALTNSYFLKNGVGIQFYFAGTTPDYVDSDTHYPTYNSANEQAMAGPRDATNAMNMYFINSTNEGYGGYAYYPVNAIYSTRSIILNENNDQDMGNRLVPHELGHNFNLIHTYGDNNGTGGSTELVTRGAGANCTTAGDLVCDTQADPYGATGATVVSSGSPPCLTYTGTITDANGAQYQPPLSNIMSYYFPCTYDFTTGQYNRIDAGLALRQSHTAYTLTYPATAVNTPTNVLAINGNGSVVLTWTDNASNEMGYFIERSTSSSSGFVPIGGVAPNTTTFTDATAPGSPTVYYRVRPSNSTTGGISANASVTTPACRPVFSRGCTDNDGINSFVFNGLTLSQNTGCASGTIGYSQYTTTTPAVSPGFTYPFSGTLLSASYQEGITIWADLNRNGLFSDAGEQLFQSTTLVTGSFSGNLTIPASTSAGIVAVRVVALYNGTSSNPCGSYSYGETEDYQLNVGVATAGCDPLEPNDTYQTATTLTAGANYTSPPVCFSVTSDNDWFRWSYNGQVYYILAHPYNYNTTGPYQLSLTFTNNNLLTVSTGPTSSGTFIDTYLKLYSSDGTTLLVQDDDSGEGAFSQLLYALSGAQPCLVPNYLSVYSVNTTSAQLSWQYNANAQYQLRYRPVGSTTWITSTTLSSSSYSLTGLSNSTTYETQVQNVCSATNVSGYTNSTTFTTGCFVPAYQSAPDITSTSAYLYWEGAGAGVQYELNYRIVGAANWTSISSLTAPSYTLTGLTNGTNYEFRVRVLCGGGNTSGFTTPTAFRTNCNTPGGLYALGYSTGGTRAYVSWSGTADGQTRYEVRHRPVGSSTWATATNPASTTNTYRDLIGLTPNTIYEAQVRTLCSDGNSSTFTASASFTTTGCSAPYNLYTYNTTVSGTTLNWDSSEPGSTFSVRYRATGSANWVYTFPISVTAPFSLTGISTSTTYQWEVGTNCPGSVFSGYVAGPNFTTLDCTAPTNLASGSPASTSTTVTWNVSLANVPVEVQWRTVGSTVWNSTTTVAGATNYGITGLTAETTYQWQLRTICTATTSSGYVSGSNFTTSGSVCRPTYSNGCGSGDALVSFSLDDVPLSQNTGCSTGSYTSVITSSIVSAGQTVNVGGLFSGTYPEGVVIWADLNRNNLFESNERLYETASGTGSFSGTLTIPPGTANGSLLMRVMVVYNVNASAITDPCGSYGYGETEDYRITVGVPTSYDPRTVNITRTSALLKWNQLTAGLTYEVQWRQQGAGSWNTVTGVATTSYSLTGLLPNTAYQWQMRPTGGSYNGPVNFTTVGCFAPISLNVYNIYPTSVNVQWSRATANPGSTVYELQYKPLASGVWTTVSNLTTTTYSITGLPTNTDYQWQVRSMCSASEGSLYATGTNFRTLACTTPTPYAASPSFGSANLSWSYISSDVNYEVQWQTAGATGWSSTTVVSSTSYSLTGLTVNTAYNWRVRTLCSASESSTFSAPGSFTTVCRQPTSLVSSDVSSYAATLGWSNTLTGALYTVWWRPQGSSTWNTPGEYLPGSPYVLTSLTNGTTYEWRVDATCPTASATVTSGFSGTATFATACPAPTNFAVYNSSPGVYTTWNKIYGVAYQVQWRPQGTSVWTASPVLNEPTLNNYSYVGSYRLENPIPNTTYEFRIQALCTNGVSSTLTAPITLTTSPAVSCSPTTPTYSNTWAIGATAATLYWYTYAPLAELRWRAVGQTAWNIASKIRLETYFTISGLQPRTTYEWQVGGLCDGQPTVAYGPVQTFTTTSCTPPTPVLSDFAGCNGPTSAFLNWYDRAGGSYEVQYQPVGGSAVTISGIIATGTTTGYSLTGLTTGTVYQWQVRAVCGAGQSSSFSSPVSFTTACNAPTGLYSFASEDCSSQSILWRTCALNAWQYEVQYRRQGASSWTPGGTVTGNNVLISSLLPATGYDYRVRTLCGNGIVSDFTVGSFTSNSCSLCDAPYSYYLAVSDITANAATVKWGSSTSTNTYRVRWKAGYTSAWSSTVVTGSSYRITGLTIDTPYDWQVQSLCSSGQYSGYSLTSFFRTVCNIPLSVTATGVRSTSALLGWNGYGSGVTYEAQLRQQGGGWTTFTNISSESLILTNLSTGTTYEGRVGTRCADGSVTDYSAPTTFKTVCQEPLYLYTSSTDPHSALFNWRGNVGDVYEMQWRAQGNNTWNTLSISAGNSALASILLTSLTGATVYEWQVRTVCGGGTTSAYPTQPLTFVTPPDDACAGGMTTIRNGDWNDPGTWACNRIPTSTDAVTIGHIVTVPTGITGNALRISYGAGGKLIVGSGSKVRLGP